MKNKWFVGLATGALATAMCISFAACSTYKGSENGKSDADKVAEAIETLDFLYGDSAASTASNYDLVGHVVIKGESIPVTWEAKSTAVTNLKDYVSIGTMDEDYVVPVSITRGEVDVAYTLVATVTSGKVSDTVSYDRVVPKGLAAKEGVVVFDFSNADGNGASLYNAQALALFNGWAEGEDTPLTAVETNTVYQGNGSGGGTGYEFEGGFLKMGKSSGTGSIKLTFAYPVTEVSVEAEGWPSGSTITNLTVNGSAGQDLPQKAADVVTFTLTTPATEVTVTSNGRAFLHTLSATWQEGVHHHVWEYEHTDGFKHTRTCTADDCTLTEKTETVDCQVFDSVCKLCEHTYTAKETVDALYALTDGASLPGTYKLSGIVTKVEDANDTFHNVTPTITVEGKSVVVYRAVSPEYNTIKTGDTITAHGLLKNRSGVYEFDQGGAILSVVDGSKDMDDATKVSTEKDTFTLDTSSLKNVGDFVTLPATGVYGTTLSWNVPQNDYLSNDNGKLTVTKLPETGSETITITLTITSGSESDTKDFTVTISAAAASDFTPITAPTPGEDYYLAMDIKGTWYYSIGAMSTHFLGSTTEIGSAAKVTLAGDETNGYTLVTNGKYIEIEQVDGYNNIALKDSQTEGKVWKWDAEHTVFTMTVGSDTFFMGTYGDYTTFNAANSSYLDDANEYIGRLGTYSGTVTPPDVDPNEKKISFSDTANRSSITAEEEIWSENGITVTHKKGTGSDIDTEKKYSNPIRIYKNHTLKVECGTAFSKLVIIAEDNFSGTYTSPYLDDLVASLTATSGVTVTNEGTTITVILDVPATSFEFTETKGQGRIYSIELFTDGAPEELDDADKVAGAKSALTLDTSSLKNVGDTVALPATGAYDTTIAWSVEANDYLAVEGGFLKVTKLPDSGSQTITVTAAITSGDAHDTKTFSVVINAAPKPGDVFTALSEPIEGDDYYMSMKIADGKEHYITGKLSSNTYYLTTTTELSGAAKVSLKADGEGWLIMVGGQYLELSISGTHANPVFKAAQTSGMNWKWDSQYKIFTWTDSSNSKWFLGTRSDQTYNTIGGCAWSYVSGNYKAVIGAFGTIEKSDETKVGEVLASLTITPDVFGKGIESATLTTTDDKYGATIAWTVADHTELVDITGGTLTIKSFPSEQTTVKIHVVVSLNDASVNKDIEITVNPEETHIHTWTYVWIDGTWTHTKKCSDPNCPDVDKAETTEDCTPNASVCACGHTYSPEEIATAASKLTTGQSLPGTYELVARLNMLRTTDYDLVVYSAFEPKAALTKYMGLVGSGISYGDGIDSAKVKTYAVVKLVGTISAISSKSTYKYGFAQCTITDLIPAEKVLTETCLSNKDLIFRQPCEYNLSKGTSNGAASLTVNYAYEIVGEAPDGVKIVEVPTGSYHHLSISKIPEKGQPAVEFSVKVTATCGTGENLYTGTKTFKVTLQYGNVVFTGGSASLERNGTNVRMYLHVNASDYTEDELRASTVKLVSSDKSITPWSAVTTGDESTFVVGQDCLISFSTGYMSGNKGIYDVYYTIGNDSYKVYLDPANAIAPTSSVQYINNITCFLTTATDEAGTYLKFDASNNGPQSEDDKLQSVCGKYAPDFTKLVNVNDELDLTVTNTYGVTAEWKITVPAEGADAFVKIDGNTLKIVKLPDVETSFTLVVTLHLEGATKDLTKSFTFTLIPAVNKTVTGFHDYEIWSDNAAVTINFWVDTEGYTKEDVQGAKLVIGSHEISPRASSEYMIGTGNQSKLWFEIHGLEDMNEVKLVLKIGSDSYDVVSTVGHTGTKTMNGKDYILGKDETNHLHITIKDAGEVPSEKSVDFNGGGAVYQDVGGRNRLLLQVKTSGYTTEELKAAYVKIGTKQFTAEPDSASTPGQTGAMFFFTDGIGDLTAGSYQIILHIGNEDYPVHTTVGLPGDAGQITHTDGDKTVTLTLVGTESDKELHLVITGGSATDPDQEKVDEVLATLTLSKTSSDTLNDEIDLPTTNDYSATVTWTLKDGESEYVKIEGNKLTVTKLPTVATTVSLHVVVELNSAKAEKDDTFTVNPAANKYGTKDAPITVTQALAIATEECANSNDVTAQIVYAKGIALSTPEASGTYYKQFELRDETDTTKKIIVFTINLDANVPAIAQNDIIVIHGYIKNYNGTMEFASNNNVYVYCVSNTRGESTITLGNHEGATVTGIQTGDKKTNGTEVTFSVAAESGKKIVAVKANGTSLVATENTYKFTVQGDTTVTVETAGENESIAELLYSLNSAEQPIGTNSSYTGSCNVTYENVTWVVEGNSYVDTKNKTQKPWRFGGKNSNCSGVDRKLTGKTAISGKVSKVTLQLTDSGSITINSVTLKVYKSDPTVSGAQVVSTKTVTYQKGVAVDVMAGTDDWTNCFFEIVFNLTVSGKSNKYVSIDKFEFYGTPAE